MNTDIEAILDVLVTSADGFRTNIEGPTVFLRIRQPGVRPGDWSRTASAIATKGYCAWNQNFTFALPARPYELEVALYETRSNNFVGQAICNISELSLDGRTSGKFAANLQVASSKSGLLLGKLESPPVVHICAALRKQNLPSLLSPNLPKLPSTVDPKTLMITGGPPFVPTSKLAPTALYSMPGKSPLVSPPKPTQAQGGQYGVPNNGPLSILPVPPQYLSTPPKTAPASNALVIRCGYNATASPTLGNKDRPVPVSCAHHGQMSHYNCRPLN